jgi:hypothetical protein
MGRAGTCGPGLLFALLHQRTVLNELEIAAARYAVTDVYREHIKRTKSCRLRARKVARNQQRLGGAEAATSRAPSNYVSSGNNVADQIESSVYDFWLVVKFDNERQVDGETQQIRRMYGTLASKTCNPAKHDNAVDLVLILKDVE